MNFLGFVFILYSCYFLLHIFFTYWNVYLVRLKMHERFFILLTGNTLKTVQIFKKKPLVIFSYCIVSQSVSVNIQRLFPNSKRTSVSKVPKYLNVYTI